MVPEHISVSTCGSIANLSLKMFETSLMSSIMIIPTTRKIMFIASAEQVVLDATAQLSPCSLPRVSDKDSILCRCLLTNPTDAKHARDLLAVLTESKQIIDPRLADMGRYGGGGGGSGRSWGGRGGGRGGRGGGFTASNAAPLGRSRW